MAVTSKSVRPTEAKKDEFDVNQRLLELLAYFSQKKNEHSANPTLGRHYALCNTELENVYARYKVFIKNA